MLSASSPGARGPRARKSAHKGAGLIEVLVAILVASLGLLAFAGSTAASVRYTKMAQFRATATQLAGDISERARANIVNGVVTPYEVRASFSAQGTLPAVPAALCDAPGSTCSVAQIAELDLYQWRLAVRSLLPEGSVWLEADVGAPGAFDLWIGWRDPSMAIDEASTVGTRECPTDLGAGPVDGVRCLYFRVKL